MATDTIPFLPKPIDGLGQIFGDISNLPPWDSIPEEFKRYHSNPWGKLVGMWFFRGLKENPKFKPGIDADAAMGALVACLRSFAPKHEHKTAGVAYLMSLWCEPESLNIEGED